MKNNTFINWTNSQFPNPKDFSQILGIREEDELIETFYKKLKFKNTKQKQKIKTKKESESKKMDITFHTDFINFINLSD